MHDGQLAVPETAVRELVAEQFPAWRPAPAGMHTAWVCGDERRPLTTHPECHVSAANLSGIAQEILAQLAE